MTRVDGQSESFYALVDDIRRLSAGLLEAGLFAASVGKFVDEKGVVVGFDVSGDFFEVGVASAAG